MTLVDTAPRRNEAAAPDPLVRIENLTASFPAGPGRRAPHVDVVRGVSLSVDPGTCVAIVGESGSGKSVTARSLLGLAGASARIEADALEIGGRDARRFSDADWRAVRGGEIGMVLQDALVSLDPLRTVGAEIAEVLRTHRVVPRAGERDRAIELLAQVGVPSPETRIDQHPHELSGGLRQRALIATAIAADPRLIIADEPTTALDVTVQKQVLDTLRARVDAGSGLLLISHDLAVVAGIADHVVVMRDGAVVEQGSAARVLGDPQDPYTRRLIAAIPSARSRGSRLSAPEEAPESPIHNDWAHAAARLGAARSDGPRGGGDNSVAEGSETPVLRDRSTESASLCTEEVGQVAPVLEARGLRKTFRVGRRGEHVAVRDVSFAVGRGETLGIVGESGSGKSTVVNLLLGLLEPDAGEVRLEQDPWAPLPERARRSRRGLVQLISQDPLSSFDPRWTVERVIAESTRARGLSRRDARRTAAALLDRVGLPERVLDRQPRSLSGGQRQRVSIARALAPDPRVLVCDEPTSALDVSVQAQVLDLLAELQSERGMSLVFVSHDLGVVHHIADRVLVMKDAAVVEEGPVDDVLLRPAHDYTRRLIAALPAQVRA